jgi:5'-AMP-activated protein kinase, regulatory gamma subunit
MLTNPAPAQRAIREFLKVRTTYDVMPLSFRLIVLDNHLLIKKSLNIMVQNGMCSLQSREVAADLDLFSSCDRIRC